MATRGRSAKPDIEQDRRGKPERARYEFVERLPDGVTPGEARERVVAVLGALIAEEAKR